MFLLSFSPSHFAHVLKVYFVKGSAEIHRISRGYENGTLTIMSLSVSEFCVCVLHNVMGANEWMSIILFDEYRMNADIYYMNTYFPRGIDFRNEWMNACMQDEVSGRARKRERKRKCRHQPTNQPRKKTEREIFSHSNCLIWWCTDIAIQTNNARYRMTHEWAQSVKVEWWSNLTVSFLPKKMGKNALCGVIVIAVAVAILVKSYCLNCLWYATCEHVAGPFANQSYSVFFFSSRQNFINNLLQGQSMTRTTHAIKKK